AVVTLAGPRGEHQQDLRPRLARDDVPLVRVERDHGADAGFELVAARLDLGCSVDDDEKRVLLHLVVAELLPRKQSDQDGPARLRGMQDDGGSTSVRRLDLRQSPAAHGTILTGLLTVLEPRLDSPS